MRKLKQILSWLTAGILLLFTARRLFFLFHATRPARPPQTSRLPLPTILLLVPFRNESQQMPALLHHLSQLNYPPQKLQILLIDDGSTDELQSPFSNLHSQFSILKLPQNMGKAAALNAGIAHTTFGDIIVVFDADDRPQPDCLRHLGASFTNPKVGLVSGQRAVSNGEASWIAAYGAMESVVHQWITLRAKERLRLAPPSLGSNCAYRRIALAAVSGFQASAFLEDSEITVRLTLAGWETQYMPAAISHHRVPETVTGFCRQHLRWNHGFMEVAKSQSAPTWHQKELPSLLRLELLLFSCGYLDRLALLVHVILHPKSPILPISLLTPLLQVIVALKVSSVPVTLWRSLFILPVGYVLDVVNAGIALLQKISGIRPNWQTRM